jgi:hypothetical protein
MRVFPDMLRFSRFDDVDNASKLALATVTD